MKYYKCPDYIRQNELFKLENGQVPCPSCIETDKDGNYLNKTIRYNPGVVASIQNPYWKPCGHSSDLTCNCTNNGATKSVEGELKKDEMFKQLPNKCTCDIVMLMQEGCVCNAIKKYKPEDIK